MEEEGLLKLIIGKLSIAIGNLDSESIGDNLYVNCVLDERIYQRFKNESDRSKKYT